jgi:glycosyltransferase involved in cell wall biosynthesis
MHIVINANFYQQPNTGSGQYLHGLLSALPAVAPQHRFTLLMLNTPQNQAKQADLPAETLFLTPPAPLAHSANLQKLWFEQIAVPRVAQRLRADLLHIPYFAAPFFSRIPVVVSILDLIPLILPAYRGNLLVQAYMRLVAAAARRARHVITISHASQADIQRQLGIPAHRISVTHLAAGNQYLPADKSTAQAQIKQRYNIDSPFIYYVGGHDQRKNVATLVRGYAEMRRRGGPNIPLVIAGRALGNNPALFPNLDRIIHEEQIGHWVQRLNVPTADGARFYQAAHLFAAPSAYEGFGLAPLEAMACGTPVVAAQASSTPEVVGDAAILVPPYDVIAWAEALRRVLEQPELWQTLRNKGLQRAQQFSYRQAAMQTVKVYETVKH